MNQDYFTQRHPLVMTSYYIVALVMVMSTTNPLIIGSFFLGSFGLRLMQLKGKPMKQAVSYPLFFLVVTTISNPLFVHRGGTILFFLFGKPVTLEAFNYGFQMGVMIATVIFLFQCFQASVDMEAFFYLFGGYFPKLTLILTMILRFIPLFQRYFQELNQVQTTVKHQQETTLKEKASHGLDLFGNLFSWALENAMDTADSMKARGYGIGKRTSRLTYRWQVLDTLSMVGIGSVFIVFLLFSFQGSYAFRYYPYTEAIEEVFSNHVGSYLLLIIFAIIPVMKSVKEAVTWTILKSKI